MQYYVYIMTNKRKGTLYIGVTSNLKKRVYQHKNETYPGFSQKYKTKILVYFEIHTYMYHAVIREKRIKKWKRDWKVSLIESMNPKWHDLYGEISNIIY